MAAEKVWDTTDVVIIGCGPTGALLSALLGDFGINNIVLEKEPDVTDDPRGITLDEDGIRLLQGVGLYDKVYTEIGSPIGMVHFITSKDSLHERPFLKFNLDTSDGGTGHVGIISQRQPVLERYLRTATAKQKCSQLRPSCTVTHIEEDAHHVYCHYTDDSGARKEIRTKLLVGADGKTGFTRKMYLEPKGVMMEQISTFGYKETWIALNMKLTLPTRESHSHLPFWDLGFTAEQIYDLYFPKSFRFICNADRPAVCGRFGNGVERLWRFEFVVKPGEDAMMMAGKQKTMEIILPYLTHAGSEYGISVPNIQFPLDCLEILRSRPFTFSARSCNKWHVGRVMLAGDAAHVFPPFGGQGIVSGFRDASSLAWRLAIAIRENTPSYDNLLAGWSNERQQQLQVSLARTIQNGSLCTEGNTWKFVFMKFIFRLIQAIPSLNRKLEQGPRAHGLIRYKWQEGLPFLGEALGGITLPQVYCAPLSKQPKKMGVSFTDDVIFAKDKVGMFQLVVLLDSLHDLPYVRNTIPDLSKLSGNFVLPEESTFIVQAPQVNVAQLDVANDVFRLATAEEFALDDLLCRARPAPQYYDMYQMKKDLQGKRFVVVRPDLFVYAACDTAGQLQSICEGIPSTLGII